MKKVFINDILQKQITEIETATEMLFFYYIDMYLKERGYSLYLTNIEIKESILKTYYYFYVYHNAGFQIPIPQTREKDALDQRSIYEHKISDDLIFEKEEETVVFDIYVNVAKQRALSKERLSTGYINLYAKMVVAYYIANVPMPKIKIKGHKSIGYEGEFTDLVILKNLGNKLLDGRIELESNNTYIDAEWLGYVTYRTQEGYMLGNYTTDEKKENFKKLFKKDQIILLYFLEKNYTGKVLRNVKQCFPAKIISWNDRIITLEYYPIVETKLTTKRKLETFEKEGITYLTGEDFTRFIKRKETFYYESTGIGDICNTRSDDYWLTPVFNGTDTTEQIIIEKDKEIKKKLNTKETIKTVLKDRGVI